MASVLMIVCQITEMQAEDLLLMQNHQPDERQAPQNEASGMVPVHPGSSMLPEGHLPVVNMLLPPSQPMAAALIMPQAVMPASDPPPFIPAPLVQQLRAFFAEERAQLKRQLEVIKNEILEEYDRRQRMIEEQGSSEGLLPEGLPSVSHAGGGKENHSSSSAAQHRFHPGHQRPHQRQRRLDGTEDKHANVPIYIMEKDVKTVADLWIEYTQGWRGGPSVKELNEKYGTRCVCGPLTHLLLRRRCCARPDGGCPWLPCMLAGGGARPWPDSTGAGERP